MLSIKVLECSLKGFLSTAKFTFSRVSRLSLRFSDVLFENSELLFFINPFVPNATFPYLIKTSPYGFLMFSKGMEMPHCEKMSERTEYTQS